MPRRIIVLVPLLVLALAVSACDDDGGPTSPTPITTTPTPTEGARSTPTLHRVTPPADVGEFLAQYTDKQMIQQLCTFDAAAGQVDCGENGLYQPDPVPADENAQCEVLMVDNEPIAVSCETQEPLTVIYYAIQ